MDLASLDQLAHYNNGVKFPIVCPDVFDRTVYSKGMKTKDSKEKVRVFWIMITKKSRPRKIWFDKGIEFAGEYKKICKAEGIQIYSTMSETKAAFAERTQRFLKKCFTFTWTIMDTSTFKKCLISSQPRNPVKMVRKT